MKHFTTNDGELYVGTAREICNLYNDFADRGIAIALFVERPKFNMNCNYGLRIDDDGFMTIINSSTVLDYILKED